MKTFAELGTEIGELVERKNAAYGSSFAKAGAHLRLLYPDGLKPEQYDDALLLVRIFDKQMRIATDRDALGESPYGDISGYGILGAHMHQQQKERIAEWLDNASGPVAENSSEVKQPGSTAPTASDKTAPSTNAKSVPEPLPQPDGCCEQLTSAPAPTATEAASLKEVDLLVIRDGRLKREACMDCDVRDGKAYCTMNCGPCIPGPTRKI